jgi:hypothetical protein
VYPDGTFADSGLINEDDLSETFPLVAEDTVEKEFFAAVKAFEAIWGEKVDMVERGWIEAVGFILPFSPHTI